MTLFERMCEEYYARRAVHRSELSAMAQSYQVEIEEQSARRAARKTTRKPNTKPPKRRAAKAEAPLAWRPKRAAPRRAFDRLLLTWADVEETKARQTNPIDELRHLRHEWRRFQAVTEAA